eukprot:TRINITY_DN48528_c0_g1_i1.p1 TRINITY_DN48528_c0_g1~~TRINITY_DN48528_c0_g1_i1.p1  ORF type:complete len:288 (+),score=27.96 TRINITY_DN48528_c0_g1_i1:100-963(+)
MEGYFEYYQEAPSDSYDREGEVHVVLCGIDYSCDTQSWAGQNPLDTAMSFQFLQDLVAHCQPKSQVALWNEQCTKEGVMSAIQAVGSATGPNDYFVFYYTGHGDQLPQDDAGETEALDQCFCLVDGNGNTDIGNGDMGFRTQAWMRDDDFAKILLESVHPDAIIIILIDACHSGSMCDFDSNPRWAAEGRRAISITGCNDKETSAGTGLGGYFTHSKLCAIQDLQDAKDGQWYAVSELFNATLKQYIEHKQPGHTQQITIHGSQILPHECVWPLKPQIPYIAPANRG